VLEAIDVVLQVLGAAAQLPPLQEMLTGDERPIRHDWNPTIANWALPGANANTDPLFRANDKKGFLVAVEAKVKKNGQSAPKITVVCSLKHVDLVLIAPASFIEINFDKIEFRVDSAAKMDVDVRINDIKFVDKRVRCLASPNPRCWDTGIRDGGATRPNAIPTPWSMPRTRRWCDTWWLPCGVLSRTWCLRLNRPVSRVTKITLPFLNTRLSPINSPAIWRCFRSIFTTAWRHGSHNACSMPPGQRDIASIAPAVCGKPGSTRRYRREKSGKSGYRLSRFISF
jgi:hypothetical protein